MMDEKKKLLITASTFPRYENDTEPRFILDLAKALTLYYEVTVLVPAVPEGKQKETIEGVNVIRYHYFPVHKYETLCYPGAIVPRIKEKKLRILLVPFLFLGLFLSLFKCISEYDIVHANWVIPQGIVQSFFKTPYVVTGHGGDIKSLNFFPFRQMRRRCLEKASAVTVVSNDLKNYLIEKETGIDWNNISVIPMGCNISDFGRENYIENYFFQGSRKVILFVGRLAEKKGVIYLLEAMKFLDALLVIAGDGPLKSVLQEKQNQVNSQAGYEKVRMIGAKSHQELKTIYASADILAVPSVVAKNGDSEGVPTVIFEAFASGIPVVATRHGGIAEVVRDNENGLLVEERDAAGLAESLSKLMTQDELYQRMSRCAYETALGCDYKIVAAKYADVFKNVKTRGK